MKRSLPYINLVGIVALVILCVAQWRRDRELNLHLRAMEKHRIAQEQKITDQQQSIKGLTDDLTQFKERFALAQTDSNDARQKAREFERENGQLTSERDQLKQSITNWAKAVTARDEQLKEANDRIRALAADLTASVQKFNALATNYNALVSEVNAERSKTTPAEKK